MQNRPEVMPRVRATALISSIGAAEIGVVSPSLGQIPVAAVGQGVVQTGSRIPHRHLCLQPMIGRGALPPATERKR